MRIISIHVWEKEERWPQLRLRQLITMLLQTRLASPWCFLSWDAARLSRDAWVDVNTHWRRAQAVWVVSFASSAGGKCMSNPRVLNDSRQRRERKKENHPHMVSKRTNECSVGLDIRIPWAVPMGKESPKIYLLRPLIFSCIGSQESSLRHTSFFPFIYLKITFHFIY